MPPVHLLWNFPPPEWTLAPLEAHVWSASWLAPDGSAAELAQILSSDERERASRFHFVKDKNRFIAARGFLRKILGSYLKIEPREIIFEYGAHGKPVLRDKKSFQFNLSHSGDLMLCAISRESDLGVDLEKNSPLSDADKIVERFFARKENALWKGMNNSEKEKFFYRTWTRREAVMKCHGQGFDDQLEPDRLWEKFNGIVYELQPAENYSAALAVAGDSIQLQTWQWPVLFP